MRRALYSLSIMGLVVSVTLVALCLLSVRWLFGYVGGAGAFVFDYGEVYFTRVHDPALSLSPTGWLCELTGESPGFWRLPHFVSGGVSVLYVPLWLPFLVVAIPSVIVWWRSRRARRGHCERCGYNLAGNVSGICPECGTAIESP